MTDWARIHEDKAFRLSYLPLSLMSLLYGIGVRIRLKKIKPGKKMALPGFTVSIGNITAGGTGKTPATCMMAEWALGEGYNAAILSRGYGGRKQAKVTVVSDGRNILTGPEEAGDEPYLLAKRLPGIPVITSKDRYLAGLTAHENFGSSFFILDDGYQHLGLKRDLNLLLLDAGMPFGNGLLLPRGPLREPVSEISRADAIILTRAGSLREREEINHDLNNLLQDKPVFLGDHLPDRVIFPFRETGYDMSFLKGKRVAAFAGIARPDSFRDILIKLGAEILYYRSFPDHHPFSYKEIRILSREREKTGADFLITTEKDWMRIRDIMPGDRFACYLKIRFDLVADRAVFFRMLREKIDKTACRQ
jgi:tetraacyldisaccharide 4'-kinase